MITAFQAHCGARFGRRLGAQIVLWLLSAVSIGRSGVLADRTFQRVADTRTGWLTSLKRADDTNRVEFLRPGQALGPVQLRVRGPGAAWREVTEGISGVEVASRLFPRGEALRWEITVKNTGTNEPLEIGDLALPLPMNTDYVTDHEETFVRRVFRHAFIAGHGSFLYWLPVQGQGWFLVLLPEADTHLEFFTAEGMDYAFGKERFSVFIHSKASAELDPRGTWRQPRTSRLLRPGEAVRYTFGLHWADSYAGVRELLRRNGGIDVEVVPGMVICGREVAELDGCPRMVSACVRAWW